MEEGKQYNSTYKNVIYNVRILPVEVPEKGYKVAVYSNNYLIGKLEDVLSTVDEALKKGADVIIKYHDEALERNMLDVNADGTQPQQASGGYKDGDIKLTWVDNKDNGKIYSQIFSTPDEALKNADKTKKNWLMFKLTKDANNDTETWNLMPLGSYKSYRVSNYVADNFLIKAGILVLAGFGTYFIVNAVIKSYKSGIKPAIKN